MWLNAGISEHSCRPCGGLARRLLLLLFSRINIVMFGVYVCYHGLCSWYYLVSSSAGWYATAR